MPDLTETLALKTGLSREQAEVLAQSWAWLAAERGWSQEHTEHTALMCVEAGVHPYDLARALAPVQAEWSIEMTTPRGLRTPVGHDGSELRRVALDLAVQSIEATSAIGGWVDEARTAVLDTAEVYLAWLTGERHDDEGTQRTGSEAGPR